MTAQKFTKAEAAIAQAILTILSQLPQRGDYTASTLTAQNISGRVRRTIPTISHNACTAVLFALAEAEQVLEHKQPKLPARFAITRAGRKALKPPAEPVEAEPKPSAPEPVEGVEASKAAEAAISRVAEQHLRAVESQDQQLSLLDL